MCFAFFTRSFSEAGATSGEKFSKLSSKQSKCHAATAFRTGRINNIRRVDGINIFSINSIEKHKHTNLEEILSNLFIESARECYREFIFPNSVGNFFLRFLATSCDAEKV